jgi:hypothetical protein
MGSFVVWDLIRQFGTGGLAGHVVVSQGPSDLKRPDWDLGAFTPAELYELLAAAQAVEPGRRRLDLSPLTLKQRRGSTRRKDV